MTPDEIRTLVLEKLVQVAPDIEPAQLDTATPIRDQYDFDSMDFLHFAIALGQQCQLEIPEHDYTELQSVDGAVDYLVKHSSGNAAAK